MRTLIRHVAQRLKRKRPTVQAGADGFLTRLRRDKAGNMLVLTAAAIFPLLAIVGGGLDLSRAYLVRTRLQQACDAGVLAGRRMMGSGGSLTNPVKAEMTKYVGFNFPDNSYQTSSLVQEPTLTSATGAINLKLSTSMDTAIMRMFDRQKMDVTVSCSARDDYSNIDIMLVLDTTGSMACKPSRTAANCNSFANSRRYTTTVNNRDVEYILEETDSSGNISRMQALRNALSSLQSQMAQIETNFNTAPAGSRKRVRWAVVPFSMMVNPGLATNSSGQTLYSRKPGWFNTTGTYAKRTSNWYGDTWTTTANPTHGATWFSNTWDGCVEERKTSNLITASSNYQIPGNLPAGAFDLQFDTVPTSTDTRWTVADRAQVGTAQYACPKPMLEWRALSTSAFNDYFSFNQGFVANGGTYLDLGMIWAARMLSRTGLWSTDNPATHNGFPVKRYVIFMTDGEMDTGGTGYSAYAQEAYWKRVAADGTDTTADANHSKRLLMTCSAIKNMDTKIFVISFGAASTLSGDLEACSSGAGYGYKADDADELNKVFRTIGENIGSLRLSS